MKRLAVILLLCVLTAVPFAARADVAPPFSPPGANLVPGAEITQVRMMAETVVIAVRLNTPGSLPTAEVTADFTMRNLGAQDESMTVRFPMSSNDGRGGYPAINGILVKVNGMEVPTRIAWYPGTSEFAQKTQWADFDVTFPAESDVAIEVRYDLEGTGYEESPYPAFYYVLASGAGWKDSIGTADIILRLPYPASRQNISLDAELGIGWTTPGGVISGSEMRWHLEDLEPDPAGDFGTMHFVIVSPFLWQEVLKQQQAVSVSPNDGEAWGRLGMAYKPLSLTDTGWDRQDPEGIELYNLSISAYERCLQLLPNDAEWHAGFAQLLAEHRIRMWLTGLDPQPAPEVYHGLEEIQTALQLAPDDRIVRDIAQQISGDYSSGMPNTASGYDFVWLTQTPTAGPDIRLTYAPTPTGPPATPTWVPSPPPVPSPTNTPGPTFPVCAPVAIVPAAIAFWVIKKRQP
jgi:hypothetical protein